MRSWRIYLTFTKNLMTLVPPSDGRTEHDELVNGVEVNEAQADEKWNFVGKKRASLHR